VARLNESRIGAFLTEPFGGTFSIATSTSVHAEHGTTLLLGLDADVVVGSVRGRAIVVPPDADHAARCPGPTVSYVFDPELCPRVAGYARAAGIHALPAPHARHILGSIAAHAGSLAQPAVLSGVGAEAAAHLAIGDVRRFDRRIVRLLDELRDPAADRAAAVQRTRLSPAHLQFLFARDVGVPIRRYGVWRRLLHGLAHVGPLDFTAAAHAAGFADLGHFSRTCRRMLGLSPSELRGNLVGG
jgi:AraC-like DNA-binding protein